MSSQEQTFEIFLLYQPHRNPDPQAQLPCKEAFRAAVKDATNQAGKFTLLEHCEQSSLWAELGERVRSATFQTAGSYAQIYDLRRTPQVRDFEDKHLIDLVTLPTPVRQVGLTDGTPGLARPLKLAVFDMDSTLIEQEVIDELARSIGQYDAVAAITERAMRGELDFAGSLRERVALLKGLPEDIWDTIRPRITFAQGARELCGRLREMGVSMAVLSGGFTPLAEWVKGELGLDVAHANFLEMVGPDQEFDSVHLSGRLAEGKEIVTADRKRDLLVGMAKEKAIPLSEVLCVGDGANDLKMLSAVGDAGGVAIALKAKPKVQNDAPNKLNSQSMTDILYLFENQRKEIQSQNY